jgi:PAS domain S-box-containing protein
MTTKKSDRRIRILMVLEDPAHAGRMGAMLAQADDPGFEVRWAATPASATTVVAGEAFDLLLLHLSRPDGQGLAALDTIQAATCTPIVLLADNHTHIYMEELVQRGIQGYLPLEGLDARTLAGALWVAGERGRAEQQLRRSQAKYHTIIEELEDAYFEVDLKGNYIYVNQTAARHFKRPRHEIVGFNYKNMTTDANAQKLFKAYNEIYRTGGTGRIIDNELLLPDGSMAFTEISVALMRDEQGQPIGFRGISRDVTAKKLADRALRASEERYRLILASIEDGYYELDLHGRLTFFNDAMAHMLAYDKDWLLRVDNRAYMTEAMAEKVYQAYNEVYHTGKPNPGLEYEIVRGDGARRFVECSASLMSDDQGRPVGFRGVARDITERKQVEQELAQSKARAEEATRAKSEFLANMSHEIRTPMNGIIGMYNLLMTTELSPEQADFVETGKRSADSLLSVINDILDFSKIEAGKIEIESLDFDLRKTVEEMVSLPALQAHLKGLEFACQLDPDVPALVRGDPGRLRQVFMNLAMNAIKFTKKGEVVFRVVVEKEDDKEVGVHFSVKDTGIGIPKASRERLFQSFQQVDASTTRVFGGTGLGLAIAKQLTELMGGRIGVHSKLGEGSTFWFSLRFEKQPDVPVRLFDLPETVRSKRILIVDDNKTNLTILAGYLKHWGCGCDQATGAEMALSLMQAVAKAGAPYDLVITDMLMPGMDGAELGRRIKADPAIKEAILIMLTSQGLRGDAAAMREIGFGAYLTKPVRRSQLFDCIVTVLNRAPAQQVDLKKGPLVTSYTLSEDKRRNVRILLAEDNAINQKLAMHLMSRFGFHADAVTNGREAVQALAQTRYDLVLMDVQMPEMDGLAATRAIRDPGSPVLNHGVPIVAMTAHAMIGDRDKCLAAGMNDYVSKPIQPNLLLQTIERLLGGAARPAGDSTALPPS